jgi:hypothetical protein
MRVVLLLAAGAAAAALAAPPARHDAPRAVSDPLARLQALPVRDIGDDLHLAASACGIERWPVKTGTDSGATSISLATIRVRAIKDMVSVPRPTSSLPQASRITAQERRYYELHATLTDYRRADDYDYHLVLRDSANRTMVAEIPGPSCVGSASPWAKLIYNARYTFNNNLSATSSFKTANRQVVVRGIGFWDYRHGQRGVSVNGIELHPVLGISFR